MDEYSLPHFTEEILLDKFHIHVYIYVAANLCVVCGIVSWDTNQIALSGLGFVSP